jgi:CPA1 family monovalent cation:H+ antiporter
MPQAYPSEFQLENMMSSKRIYISVFLAVLSAVILSGCTASQLGPLSPSSAGALFQTEPTPLGAEELLPGEEEEGPETTPEDETIIIVEEIVILLLFIATLVGIVARRLRVPYTVGLVIMGLALALLPQVDVNVPRNLILGLLVPPLIFEAAFDLNVNDLRRNLAPILAWAIPGVVVTMFLVGGVVAWGTKLPLTHALLFGSLVAATDPVAVIALFSTIGVPKRLKVLLEGESLFNDGTAIVIFGIMTVVALTGEFNLATGIIDFLRISGGGFVVGIILGLLISQMIGRIDDHLIETTLTTVLAFGSYLVAEQIFHVSGVLAVVAAGLVNGNIGPRGMSPTTRIVVFNFWEYVGFIANSFAFLLIGLQIDLGVLLVYWQPIITAILAVLVARAVVIYGLAWIGRDIPLRWQHILYWGGLRGAISLALALGLPALLESRDQLQVMAFGVVVFTLLVQGFSMTSLVRRMGLIRRSEAQVEYERRHARAVAVQSAYEHLERMRGNGLISDHTWQTLSPILKEHSQTLIDSVKQVLAEDPGVEAEELDNARREALMAQRSTLTNLMRHGVISDSIYGQLIGEVDAALTDESVSWPELIRHLERPSITKLMAAVIQEQDLENAISALTKLGLSITNLPSVGGFLGRINVTLIIGFSDGQEESVVRALSQACRRRVEYIAPPIEGSPIPLPAPTHINVGGATIFMLEVERYEEF